jgi:hypothetical protein
VPGRHARCSADLTPPLAPCARRRAGGKLRARKLLGGLLLVAMLALGLLVAGPVMIRAAHRAARALVQPARSSAPEPESASLPPAIPVHELLSRLPQIPRVDNSSIPKLIHQSFKSRALPADFDSYQRSWLQQHPGWLYDFWTDEDNRLIVRRWLAGFWSVAWMGWIAVWGWLAAG